jgi:dihydrofolate reductase
VSINEGFASYWPTVADDQTAHPADRAFSPWLNETEKVISSTTVTEATSSNGRLATEEPAATVRALRARQGGDIIVLASSTTRQLLVADELDRLSITLCPEVAAVGAHFLDEMPTQSTPSPGHSVRLVVGRS